MARFTLLRSALLLAVSFRLIILMSRSETNWNKTHNCDGHSTNHWKKALRKLKDLSSMCCQDGVCEAAVHATYVCYIPGC